MLRHLQRTDTLMAKFAPDVQIDGVEYVSASEVARLVSVSRQTLWRWRHDARIPAGQRFRDGRVLFTRAQLREILVYANRLEPVSEQDRHQLKLFKGSNA